MESLKIYPVELYLKVRLACAVGLSKRAAARHFNILRDTVDKAMAFSIPPGYRRTAPVKRPKLDGFTEVIDSWLDGDKDVHRKQHHTAKRVFDRLRAEHGFTGGYTIIKDYVRERERRGREMFVPLAHPPGNLPFDEWTETCGTERLTGALLDRLTHHVNILETNGESYRLAQSRTRKSTETA
jgi:transposase